MNSGLRVPGLSPVGDGWCSQIGKSDGKAGREVEQFRRLIFYIVSLRYLLDSQIEMLRRLLEKSEA